MAIDEDGERDGVLARLQRRVKAEPLVPGGALMRRISIAVLVLLALGSGTAAAMDGMTGLPQGAAYRVGNVTVSEQQLAQRVHVLSALYGLQRPPADQPDQVDRFNRDTAKAVAVSDVMEQAAAAKGIVVPDNVAADQVDKLAEQSGTQGKQDFLGKLGQLGISEQDVITEVKRQMANTQLYQLITKDVKPVTDDEVKQAFDQRRGQMVAPEQRHLRNIVVPSQDVANQVAQRARAGEDFAMLARETSIDGSTKDAGGDIGSLAAEQLERPYADAAFSAAPNAIFGPVQTKNGWNIGQVVGVTPGQPLTYDQVKDDLRTQLDNERKSPVWDAFVADAIAKADVAYADKYRPADPAAPPNPGQ